MQVGNGGLSDAVIAKIGAELDYHELIKVKVGKEAPVTAEAAAGEIGERTGAGVAQIIGRTVVLYRPSPEEPKIVLPKPSEDDGET